MASVDDLSRSVLKPPSDVNPRTDAPLDFPDRDLGELSAADYRDLGFMGGLEVHQQLRTRSKLFCRCPAGVYAEGVDAEVLRHMRPTLSELGEYDGCALMEFKTRKEIVYQLHRSSVCTYEIDDTPPFEIDREAVEVALQVCQIFDLKLVSELHVMRKQYLDGSIPTGFQRTAMVGLGGEIPFVEPDLGVDRMLRIRQLSLEEDSCREVSDVGHRITFRTDRLGMPLTEVVTEPELLTPLEMRAGAALVARATRAGGRVRRGPGAARQDVNVSVAGGRRVEIKGVYHHRGLPLLVHNEAYRQLNLLRVREELRRRGVQGAFFALPAQGTPMEESPDVLDATGVLRSSDFAPLRDCLDRGEKAAAVRLRGFGGLLLHRTQPGVTMANEFADRVRVIACLTSRPFLIHSDIEGYGLGVLEWKQLRSALKAGPEDAVVVLWGPVRDVETAVREVFLRAQEALEGVPAETRQAFVNGTTGFERILPGADRMYPDTDTPPVPIADALVQRIRTTLPEPPWQRETRLREEWGLPFAAARRLVEAPWYELFVELAPPSGGLARRIAYAFEKRLPHHRRAGRPVPTAARLRAWVDALASGRVRPEAAEAALDRLVAEPAVSPEQILAPHAADGGEAGDLAARVEEVRAEAARMPGRDPEVLMRWAMGRVMSALLGRVSPARVRERLAPALKGLR